MGTKRPLDSGRLDSAGRTVRVSADVAETRSSAPPPVDDSAFEPGVMVQVDLPDGGARTARFAGRKGSKVSVIFSGGDEVEFDEALVTLAAPGRSAWFRRVDSESAQMLADAGFDAEAVPDTHDGEPVIRYSIRGYDVVCDVKVNDYSDWSEMTAHPVGDWDDLVFADWTADVRRQRLENFRCNPGERSADVDDRERLARLGRDGVPFREFVGWFDIGDADPEELVDAAQNLAYMVREEQDRIGAAAVRRVRGF